MARRPLELFQFALTGGGVDEPIRLQQMPKRCGPDSRSNACVARGEKRRQVIEERVPGILAGVRQPLGAYLRRQRSRLGAPKAITATAHKLARILYNLMRYGVEYMKKTEAEYADQERARQEKSFHRRAKELGYEVHRPPTNDEPIPAMA